jgi:hypothetical protein
VILELGVAVGVTVVTLNARLEDCLRVVVVSRCGRAEDDDDDAAAAVSAALGRADLVSGIT